MHKIQFRSSFKNTCFVENLKRAASDYVRFGTVGLTNREYTDKPKTNWEINKKIIVSCTSIFRSYYWQVRKQKMGFSSFFLFAANIYLFKVKIKTLERSVRFVQSKKTKTWSTSKAGAVLVSWLLTLFPTFF